MQLIDVCNVHLYAFAPAIACVYLSASVLHRLRLRVCFVQCLVSARAASGPGPYCGGLLLCVWLLYSTERWSPSIPEPELRANVYATHNHRPSTPALRVQINCTLLNIGHSVLLAGHRSRTAIYGMLVGRLHALVRAHNRKMDCGTNCSNAGHGWRGCWHCCCCYFAVVVDITICSLAFGEPFCVESGFFPRP